MINTHRENIVQILSMFCRKDTFVDIKVFNQSYLLPKVHFNAQLIMALKFAGVFEDKNNLIGDLTKNSVEQFILSQAIPFKGRIQ